MSYIEYFHAHPSMETILSDLQTALTFTTDDLELNRLGKIGPDQRRVLLRRALIPPAVALLAGILLSFGIRLLWAALAEDRSVVRFAGQLLADIFTFDFWGLYRDYVKVGGEDMPRHIRALLVLPIGFSLLHIRKPSMDALLDVYRGVSFTQGKPEATTEEKEVGRLKRNRDTVTTHYYVLNGQKYQIPPAARESLIPAVAYRLYYGKASRSVLAAEPILEEDVQLASDASL